MQTDILSNAVFSLILLWKYSQVEACELYLLAGRIVCNNAGEFKVMKHENQLSCLKLNPGVLFHF